MTEQIDFNKPIEWKNTTKVAKPGIPTTFLGVGETPRYAVNKGTRYKIALDPENLPKGIKPTAIHPDDHDKEPLSQRVMIYAIVFDTGYVGDGSPVRIENVHVRQAREQRLNRRREERKTMTESDLWGAF